MDIYNEEQHVAVTGCAPGRRDSGGLSRIPILPAHQQILKPEG